jgi:peptide/nickel transport system permease protein
MMFDGIANRDFSLVQGITLVFALGVVLVNLTTDVLYTVIDPRVALR